MGKSTRVLLSFKDTQQERKLLDFLNKESELIGKGAYIKLLLNKAMEDKKDNKSSN